MWAPDGSLLFTSARPDPDHRGGHPQAALWNLPAGGEARLVLTRPAGRRVRGRRRQRGRRRGCPDDARAARRPRPTRSVVQRKDAGVTAILHETYPIRHWDHDLGPATPHLFWTGQLPPTTRRRRGDRAAGPTRRRSRPPGPGTTSRCPPTVGWSAPRRYRRPGRATVARRPHRDRRRPVPRARRRPAGGRLPPAVLAGRRHGGLRPGVAVDLRRAAGLHAAAGRRGRRDRVGADPGLRPVAQRPAVQRRRLGGLLPGRRRRPARCSGFRWAAAHPCG